MLSHLSARLEKATLLIDRKTNESKVPGMLLFVKIVQN